MSRLKHRANLIAVFTPNNLMVHVNPLSVIANSQCIRLSERHYSTTVELLTSPVIHVKRAITCRPTIAMFRCRLLAPLSLVSFAVTVRFISCNISHGYGITRWRHEFMPWGVVQKSNRVPPTTVFFSYLEDIFRYRSMLLLISFSFNRALKEH